jgi:ABC-type branched-subunit amino acid transport system substrate-binding protein
VKKMLVVLAVVGLLVAGCSADRSEEDRSESESPGDGSTPASSEGAASFGTLESPCGEGTPGPTPSDDAQGVTDDAIAVGTIADPGFTARPGINQEALDAGEAFVAWCNEQGGINGRELQLTQYDAAFTDYTARMGEACAQEFAMVGGGAVQDNLWEGTGQACDLIDVVGFATTPEKAGESGDDPVESRTVQPVPNPQDQFPLGAVPMLEDEAPDGLDHVGILYADFGTTAIIAERTKEAYEALGANVEVFETYSAAGEANWSPFVSSLRDAGVEWFNFVGEGAFFAQLQQAMDEQDYHPAVTLQDTNLYDPEYLAAAGDAAEGTFVRSAFVPFEEAYQEPAVQEFVDMVEAVDGKVALLGAQSVSAWLLFAQAARDCDLDGDLTRTCVLEGAASVTDWDAGGLHAPTDPSTNTGPDCTVVMLVQDGAFVRYAPDEGFECDPEATVQLEGDYSSSS